jgi:hypothetical protein
MKSSNLVAFFLMIIFSPFALGDKVAYLCVADESVGFKHFPDQGWATTKFDITDEKFILRKLEHDEIGYQKGKEIYGFLNLGKDAFPYVCDPEIDDLYVCDSVIGGEMMFAPSTGRFIRTNTLGYWVGGDELSDSPYIMRGRCSKI